MFLLDELPDPEMMQAFADRYPQMDQTTTAACLRILKTASVILRELEKHFSRHGLSQARFLALIVLEREASTPQMPAEISRKMGISKKNTTRLLAFMVQDGLVRLEPHTSDRRASLVFMTDKGKAALEAAMPGYYAIMNRAMGDLNDSSKTRLISLLDDVRLDLSEPAQR